MMTSNDLAVAELPALAAPTPYELGAMSTQTLRAKLAQALTISAQTLAYLAAIWRELENRGEDLSDLRVGLAAWLPLIAAGQLDARVVVRFAGTPSVIKLVASLPLSDQEHIVSGTPLTVLTVGQDGSYVPAEMPATSLTTAQLRLALDHGRIRGVAEQRAIIESARVASARRTRPGAEARVRYDPRTDRLRIGNASAPVGEVMGAIAAAALIPATDDELDKSVIVKLTEAEMKGLKIRAAQAGLTQQEYARALLVMQNLL